MLTTIVSFIGMLVVLILVHETGHFVTAKLCKVRVEEFGIGFPPRIFGKKLGETIYSINALPLGGFVRMAGEEDSSISGSLASKSIPVRLLVLSAGSILNILLPIILLSIAFMIPHDVLQGEVLVQEIAPNSPAYEAGIEPGDILLSVNGQDIDSVGDYQRHVYYNLGNEITVTVQHADSTTEDVQLLSRWSPPEGDGATGVAITTSSPEIVKKSYPFWKAIPTGAGRYWEMVIIFKNGIIGMMTGVVPFDLRGPVGIAQLTGEAAEAGISPLLELAALISLNLGIINMFPLPALDGGRLIFLAIEVIRRGKRVSAKTENLVHTIGFLLLMGAFLAITYKDIIRFIS